MEWGCLKPTQDTHGLLDEADFPNSNRRRIALEIILLCEMFFVASFSIVSLWLPVTLQLSVFFFVNDSSGQVDADKYTDFVYRLQPVPVVALVLLCSTGWIAGIAMDTWFKKTKLVLASLILACIGFGFLVTIIIEVSYNIRCKHFDNKSKFSCQVSECLWRSSEDGYCLDFLIGCIYIISILGSVTRTALPALGGDQIPGRHQIRVFYALFYWCQKVGQMIAASASIIYLAVWRNLMPKDSESHFIDVKRLKQDYLLLFVIAGGVLISVCCVISLLSFTIVVCGKLTREVNPDFGVLRDSLFMFVEACKRRKEKQEDDQWLDTAKQSRGGSFADQAVEERRQMAKFCLVLFLLTPVAFATTILKLPVLPPDRNETAPEIRLDHALQFGESAVIINSIRYVTVFFAIPIIHTACDALVKRGRPVTLLHKFVMGHIFMVLALVVDMIVHGSTKGSSLQLHIMPMVLLGLSKAFVNTTGYELTLMSAPRAMQSTAMGLFYLVDGVANILCWIVIAQLKYDEIQPGSHDRTLLTGVGVALTCLSSVILIFLGKKFRLSLNRV